MGIGLSKRPSEETPNYHWASPTSWSYPSPWPSNAPLLTDDAVTSSGVTMQEDTMCPHVPLLLPNMFFRYVKSQHASLGGSCVWRSRQLTETWTPSCSNKNNNSRIFTKCLHTNKFSMIWSYDVRNGVSSKEPEELWRQEHWRNSIMCNLTSHPLCPWKGPPMFHSQRTWKILWWRKSQKQQIAF